MNQKGAEGGPPSAQISQKYNKPSSKSLLDSQCMIQNMALKTNCSQNYLLIACRTVLAYLSERLLYQESNSVDPLWHKTAIRCKICDPQNGKMLKFTNFHG